MFKLVLKSPGYPQDMTGITPLASLFPRNLVGSTDPDVRNQQASMLRALEDIDRLREPRLRAGVLASLRAVEDTWRVREATELGPRDQGETRQIKTEYRQLYDQTRKLQADASQLADIFEGRGDGPHRLHGGRTVVIERHADGATQVTIKRPNGETQTVRYNHASPERTTVTTGQVSVVERDGHRMTRTEGGRKQRFTLGDNGWPRLETDAAVVQVEADGSTSRHQP